MIFAKGILIYTAVIYCHPVASSKDFFPAETILSNEEYLIKEFYLQLRVEMDKWHTRDVVLAGETRGHESLIKLFIKDFTCFVIKNGNNIIPASDLSATTLVIQFLTDVSDEHVSKEIRALPDSRRVLLLLTFRGPVDEDEIETALRAGFRETEGLIFFVHQCEESVRIHNYEYQESCDMGIQLLFDWSPGLTLTELTEYSKRVKIHGCECPVATMVSPPHMYVGTSVERNTLYPHGGTEGYLILGVAGGIIYCHARVIQINESNFGASHDSEAITLACASRKAAFGIGQLSPTAKMNELVEMSPLHRKEYIIWCVPRITRFEQNVMSAEFTWESWAFIGLMFFVNLVIEYVLRNVFRLDGGKFFAQAYKLLVIAITKRIHISKERAQRSDFSAIFLDIFGITLGNTVTYNPLSRSGKTLLLTYLWYSTIITTAFKTSLSSILTLETGQSVITDTAAILRANLTPGGSRSLFYTLKDQAEDNEITAQLIARYEFEEEGIKALRRVSQDQDFAFLTKLSKLAYYHDELTKLGESPSFDILNEVVLAYSTVLIMPKRSRWHSRINRYMTAVAENGLLTKIVKGNPVLELIVTGKSTYSGGRNTTEELRESVGEKFRFIFLMYIVLISICLVTFIGELIIYEFRSKKRIRRFENRPKIVWRAAPVQKYWRTRAFE